MSEVQYFVCHASEDGGASINEYSEDELKDLLSWDDDSKQIGLMDEIGCDKFVEFDDMEFVDNVDMNACTIIRGNVVVPKERKTVTEFEL